MTGTVVSVFFCPDQTVPLAVNSTNGAYSMTNGQRGGYLLACSQYYETYNGAYQTANYSGHPPDAGIFSGSDIPTRMAEIKDGSSNTVMIGESSETKSSTAYGPYWGAGAWTSHHGRALPPNNASVLQAMPNGLLPPATVSYAWQMGSLHPGGTNCAFGDGSVKFIKNSISTTAWYGINTMAHGEVISADSF